MRLRDDVISLKHNLEQKKDNKNLDILYQIITKTEKLENLEYSEPLRDEEEIKRFHKNMRQIEYLKNLLNEFIKYINNENNNKEHINFKKVIDYF